MMTIAEKIARAKADYDEVFEAGKKSVLSVLDFTDIESSTYRSTVPSDADNFARVNKIGGMTHKTRNLIPFPYYFSSPQTTKGITITTSDSGAITINGTSDAEGVFFLVYNGTTTHLNGTYTLSGLTNGSDTTYYIQPYIDGQSQTPIYTASRTYTWNGTLTILGFYFKAGISFNNLTIYPMLNEGTTALPYEPYFEGLRSAEVTELKSEFGNLFNYDNVSPEYKDGNNVININHSGYYTDLFSGTTGYASKFPLEYTDRLMYLTAGTYNAYFNMTFDGEETNKELGARVVNLLDGSLGEGAKFTNGSSFNISKDGYYTIRKAHNLKSTITNLMITRKPQTEYIPYGSDTLPIPEAVKSLDGYGLGKNADEYNYIDFGNKIFKQDYAKVRLPSNKGTFNADSKWYYISKTELGISPLSREILCNLLPSADITANSTISGIYMSASPMNFVLIRKTEFTTEAEYKQWLTDNEVYIIERLAEPIETDISAYLTDEYIEVEGGGTVTAVNEYGLDAPTNISYLIDTQGG